MKDAAKKPMSESKALWLATQRWKVNRLNESALELPHEVERGCMETLSLPYPIEEEGGRFDDLPVVHSRLFAPLSSSSLSLHNGSSLEWTDDMRSVGSSSTMMKPPSSVVSSAPSLQSFPLFYQEEIEEMVIKEKMATLQVDQTHKTTQFQDPYWKIEGGLVMYPYDREALDAVRFFMKCLLLL